MPNTLPSNCISSTLGYVGVSKNHHKEHCPVHKLLPMYSYNYSCFNPQLLYYYISAAEGTAGSNDDFTPSTPFEITFAVGSPDTSCVNVAIVDDNVLEGDHDFSVEITNVGPSAMIGTPDSTVVTITDDESKSRRNYSVNLKIDIHNNKAEWF